MSFEDVPSPRGEVSEPADTGTTDSEEDDTEKVDSEADDTEDADFEVVASVTVGIEHVDYCLLGLLAHPRASLGPASMVAAGGDKTTEAGRS